MTLMTQAEFARHVNYDKAYVSRLKQAGRLVMVEGKVDVEASLALIEQTKGGREDVAERHAEERQSTTPRAPDAQGEKVTMSLQASRAVKENYLARMAKLNFERESGKLVESDEVRHFAADIGATFRGALEVLPDRLASELAPIADADEVRAVLVENFEQLLSDLSMKIEKGLGL